MNALPNYMLIEFFDWIKTSKNANITIGFVRECVMRDRNTYNAMDDLTPYAQKYIDEMNLDIDAWMLVESMRAYLTYRYEDEESIKIVESSLWQENRNNKNDSKDKSCLNERYALHLMTVVPDSLHIELEFLEWLLKQKLNANDIYKMPKCVFEQLAKAFTKQLYLEMHLKGYKYDLEIKILLNLLSSMNSSYYYAFNDSIMNKLFEYAIMYYLCDTNINTTVSFDADTKIIIESMMMYNKT